jgi:carboxyl-terminal processing protease
LPWDRIPPTQFSTFADADPNLSWLNSEQLQRAQKDPDFQFLLEDIELVEELRQKKSLSLNMDARKAEQDERKKTRLERENSRRVARGLKPVESIEAIDNDELSDVLLNQAAEILTDLVYKIPEQNEAVLSQAQQP